MNKRSVDKTRGNGLGPVMGLLSVVLIVAVFLIVLVGITAAVRFVMS